jgi:hypothetical protein
MYDGDMGRFVEGYGRMKRALRDLVEEATCLYVSCDMTRKPNRERLRESLGG